MCDWSLAGEFIFNEPLKKHTTFRIGGPAKGMLFPRTIEEIRQGVLLARASQLPYVILGNGSNLLVRDSGFPGVVIQLGRNFSKIERKGNLFIAQAGALMPTAAKRALKEGLTGFEFASGIPGSIGGGVNMNAGAYQGEMKDIVSFVRVLDRDLNLLELKKDAMNFSYRHSKAQEESMIIVEVGFSLAPGNPEEISALMEEYTKRRNFKQPLDKASAGSTFKRPEGYFAGKLIEDTGLRGFRYKDAMISQKHCGFVINEGEATCEDVLTLIHMVQKLVYDKFGVHLEREVKILGEE